MLRLARQIARIAAVSVISAIAGCENGSTAVDVPQTPDVRKPTRSLEAASLLLVSGIVLNPDGTPCPKATVTLERDSDQHPRLISVAADGNGRFTIYGPAFPVHLGTVWAATPAGLLGVEWLSADSRRKDVQLRGGETVLYVRDNEYQPVPGAEVTVCMSSIDDITLEVPSDIRKILARKTDEFGIVRYPSRLGHIQLGFEVNAAGYVSQRDVSYSVVAGRPKVFVLGGDPQDRARCEKIITNQQVKGQ